ncbi:MAG TPA: MFS transporter [Roseiflexaceae bacterium]|nr:MFS transporter [Roseiflexaceae bacterium]
MPIDDLPSNNPHAPPSVTERTDPAAPAEGEADSDRRSQSASSQLSAQTPPAPDDADWALSPPPSALVQQVPGTADSALGTQHSALTPAEGRRNYRLGVINGVSFGLGESLASPALVLALLIRQLGGSLALVGALPAIQTAGYLLPQLLVSGRLQARPYKLPVYRLFGGLRLLTWAALAGAIFAAGALPPAVALALVVGGFALFTSLGGVTALTFQDIVAKVIPPRRRGSFFGRRQLLAGLLTFVAGGTLVRWLLGEGGPLPFPANFGALALLSLLCFGVGIGSFALVREPPQLRLGQALRLGEGLRRAPQLLRANRNYRWFILARLLLRVGQIAEPFYIVYATESLGLPKSAAGAFVAAWALAAALSNLLWGRVSDRRGNRRLILIAGVLMALAPLLMLAGPAAVQILGLGPLALTAALGLVFLLVGAAADGMAMAGMTYLLEIVPEEERPTYMGLANTILGAGALVPVAGGWLVALLGYGGTFALGAAAALLGLAAATRLVEVRRGGS